MCKKIVAAQETAGPTVVCSGWGLRHLEVVIKAGDTTQPKSHGMCERCELFMEASLTSTPDALEQYRAYLEGITDPRD